jgi:hypothetical protein
MTILQEMKAAPFLSQLLAFDFTRQTTRWKFKSLFFVSIIALDYLGIRLVAGVLGDLILISTLVQVTKTLPPGNTAPTTTEGEESATAAPAATTTTESPASEQQQTGSPQQTSSDTSTAEASTAPAPESNTLTSLHSSFSTTTAALSRTATTSHLAINGSGSSSPSSSDTLNLHKKLPTYAIVAITCSAVAFVAILAILILCLVRRRRSREAETSREKLKMGIFQKRHTLPSSGPREGPSSSQTEANSPYNSTNRHLSTWPRSESEKPGRFVHARGQSLPSAQNPSPEKHPWGPQSGSNERSGKDIPSRFESSSLKRSREVRVPPVYGQGSRPVSTRRGTSDPSPSPGAYQQYSQQGHRSPSANMPENLKGVMTPMDTRGIRVSDFGGDGFIDTSSVYSQSYRNTRMTTFSETQAPQRVSPQLERDGVIRLGHIPRVEPNQRSYRQGISTCGQRAQDQNGNFF